MAFSTGRPNRSAAYDAARLKAMTVPPARAKSTKAAAPASPNPPRYSGGTIDSPPP